MSHIIDFLLSQNCWNWNCYFHSVIAIIQIFNVIGALIYINCCYYSKSTKGYTLTYNIRDNVAMCTGLFVLWWNMQQRLETMPWWLPLNEVFYVLCLLYFFYRQTLLDLGASPDYKDSRGLTPLYHSSMVGGDPYCCELLLHDHAQVGCVDENGWQEIHQVIHTHTHQYNSHAFCAEYKCRCRERSLVWFSQFHGIDFYVFFSLRISLAVVEPQWWVIRRWESAA